MNTCIRATVLFALVSLVTLPAVGQTIMFTVSLDNAQVPVPNYGGTGSGSLSYDTGTGGWSLSGTFNTNYGITTDAHIHGPAGALVNAAVVSPISFTTGVTSGTFSGSGTFSAGQASDLLAGLYYINIHTNFYPAGEIRGQLTAVPEPSTYALTASLLGLAAAGVWRKQRSARS